MGFVVGLIIGVVIGAFAIAADPDLPQELRARFESLTGQGTEGTGEPAEPAEGSPDETGPPANAEPPATGADTPPEAEQP